MPRSWPGSLNFQRTVGRIFEHLAAKKIRRQQKPPKTAELALRGVRERRFGGDFDRSFGSYKNEPNFRFGMSGLGWRRLGRLLLWRCLLLCCFLFAAGGLEFFERLQIVFAVAAQAVLVHAQVFQIAFVFQIDGALQKMGGDGIGQFDTAEGVDASLLTGDAQKAPFGIDQRLDQKFLFEANRLVERDEILGELLIVSNIVSGE